jgi:hypothetical protein
MDGGAPREAKQCEKNSHGLRKMHCLSCALGPSTSLRGSRGGNRCQMTDSNPPSTSKAMPVT